MWPTRTAGVCVALGTALVSPEAAAYGEPTAEGYPSREERQILVSINRVRANPDDQAAGNASGCSTPHPPVPPVAYEATLGHAARFHCRHLALNAGGLSHQTFCTLMPEIATNGCDGSASCSCVAGTECWTCTTLGGCGSGPGQRASIFGFSGGVSEVGAANYGALGAATGWATECPPAEGHRTALSNASINVAGVGFASDGSCWGNYEFADFGQVDGLELPRIPSAADGTGVIEANWYDPAGDPQLIHAVVDGICIPMTIAVGIDAGNRDYRAPFAPSGCHEYYVVAREAGGLVVRHPDVGSLTVGCLEEYVPTQADSECSACNPGETRPCTEGGCEGTQPCTDGLWGECDVPPTCGGSGGAGGDMGTGADPGTGGAADDAASDDEPDSGCSCRVTAPRSTPSGPGAAALYVMLLCTRRRRSAAELRGR